MHIAVLTREFPPDVYGGAGVHVDFLVRELRRLEQVDVHCFGDPREGAAAYLPPTELKEANFSLQTLGVDLEMAAAVSAADVVHSHTWYANMAGHLAKLLHGTPHVITAHSLEPRRPWKLEQLGGGYRVSSWMERTAYESADAIIAVSWGMRVDVLDCYPQLDPARVHVVRNGVDTDLYRATTGTEAVRRLGVDPQRPSVLFIGRITRQKGVGHLIAAAHAISPGVQVVLCAGAPDTPELEATTRAQVEELRAVRGDVIWIPEMLPRDELVELLSHSTVFVCPSVYEPLGIVNLEAMACGIPVVASDVGGIPEVVVDRETGLLVHYDAEQPEVFEAGLALAINEVLADPRRAKAMGEAGRVRAVEVFGWEALAQQTIEVYRSVL